MTHSMQGQQNIFHIGGGHGRLKSIIGHDSIVSVLRFCCFLVSCIFCLFFIKPRIAFQQGVHPLTESERSSFSLKDAFSSLSQFLATECSWQKMKKSTFYFTSIALFVLNTFKFLSWLFGHVAKRLDYKDQVIVKFYNATAWLTIVVHILSNISRSKGN